MASSKFLFIPIILFIFYQLSKTVFDGSEPDGEESGFTSVFPTTSFLFLTKLKSSRYLRTISASSSVKLHFNNNDLSSSLGDSPISSSYLIFGTYLNCGSFIS